MKAPTRPCAQPRFLLGGVLALGGLTGLSAPADAAPKTQTRTEKKPPQNRGEKPPTKPAEDSNPKGRAFYCRGGGEMHVEMMAPYNGLKARKLGLRFGFERGKRAAYEGTTLDATRLEPGTCTWADRGMKSSEPTVLLMPALNDAAIMTIYGNMATCARDEACVFGITANVGNSIIKGDVPSHPPFHRVP